jgi:hypothetical protein
MPGSQVSAGDTREEEADHSPLAAEAGTVAPIGTPEPDEPYTLADAEGGFIEVNGVEELRSTFERLLFDPTLSPAQILGLWESNEDARNGITRIFGAAALDSAEAHVQAAERRWEEQHVQGRVAAEQRDPLAKRGRPRSRSKQRKSSGGSSLPPVDLSLHIDPSWTEAEVFRHYRARLKSLQGGSAKASAIADFRLANRSVEARLRASLPHLIEQIDAIYAWAATNAA